MKLPVRVLFIILLSFSLSPARSQSRGVMAAEYFWDNDPGQGLANAMNVANGSFGKAIEVIAQSTSTLPAPGMHTLNVRAEDSTGNWGVVFSTVVQVDSVSTSIRTDNIIAGEYFWDTDPGQGSGNAMIAFDGSFNQAFEAISKTQAVLPSIGVHTLNVRAKDVAGDWGTVFKTVVRVDSASTSIRADNIISGEYFWDTDPGQGNANLMIAFDGSFNQAFEAISKNPAVLPNIGTHTLNVRAKDVAGNWGTIFTTVVQVDSANTSIRADNIISAEYFWDTDPGQGSGNPMVAFDGSFNQAFEAISKNPAVLPSIGTHTLNVRAKDIAGNWGTVFTTVVQVDSAGTSTRADNIISAEYFWDTDPGQGNANPMVAFDGSFNQAFEAISKNPAVLPSVGTHTLNVRAKDVAGNWGTVFTTVVQVDSASTSIRADYIIGAEYFWDTDPGQGNGNPMVAFDGSFNQAYEAIYQNPATLPVSQGIHTLNTRAKDVHGNWGSVFTVVVNVGATSTATRSDNVTSAEYFFDTDPGQGNGTPMSAQGSFGHDVQGLLGGSIPSPVSAGVHLLSMRAKDINGNWGAVFSIVVNIDTTIGTPNVQISGPTTLCANNLTGATYATPFVSGNTYSWSITGGTITSGSSTNSVVVNWNNSGPYKLIVTECAGAICASDSAILVVKPIATATVNHTMCEGFSFDGYTTSGTYIDTFTAANSCDSIRTLILTVLPISHSTINQSICQGQSYLGHNTTGTFNDTLTAANSCDSIRTLNLTVLSPVQTNINQSICLGQSYGGHTTTGTYTDTFTAANSCDSIRTLNLTVTNGIRSTINQSICHGQSFDGYSQTGTYIDTFSAEGGCDSIRILNLTVLNNVTTTITQSICQGLSYGGHSTNGTFVDTFLSVNGCDSIRTLLLTILPLNNTTVNKNICQGQSFDGHNTTGSYVDTFTSVNGCDSIRTLNLIVIPIVTTSIDQSICRGQSYGGHTTSGTYVDTFSSISGCDSIRTLVLSVSSSITSTINKNICQGQTFDGYSATGTYVDTFTAQGGCDSTRTLNLVVLSNITTTVNKNICQGQSYGGHSSTGTYVDTLTSSGGCDSIRTLNLLVLSTLTTSDVQVICAGQAYDGHTSTGTYVDTLSSSYGCDSIRTLHLTVNPVTNDTLTHSICQGDTFQGHSSTGLFTDSMTAVTGCDSIVTLHLIVNPIPAVPTITQQGDSLISSVATQYQWYRDSVLLTGDTSRVIVLTQNGNYTVVAGDSSGCSNTSVVTPIANVGIAVVNGTESLSIYPNPASGIINIQFGGLDGSGLFIKLNDAIGQTIIEKSIISPSASLTEQLQVQELSSGVYMLQMKCNNHIITRRVVIAR